MNDTSSKINEDLKHMTFPGLKTDAKKSDYTDLNPLEQVKQILKNNNQKVVKNYIHMNKTNTSTLGQIYKKKSPKHYYSLRKSKEPLL